MAKIKITQVRSTINCKENQKRTIKALGLSRPNSSVTHSETPQLLGMIKTVQHLVKVEHVNE